MWVPFRSYLQFALSALPGFFFVCRQSPSKECGRNSDSRDSGVVGKISELLPRKRKGLYVLSRGCPRLRGMEPRPSPKRRIKAQNTERWPLGTGQMFLIGTPTRRSAQLSSVERGSRDRAPKGHTTQPRGSTLGTASLLRRALKGLQIRRVMPLQSYR